MSRATVVRKLSSSLPLVETSRRRWIPDSIAVGVWTLAVGVFFWSVLSGQRVFFYFDVTELNYPYRAFLGHSLQDGHFPLWCPHLYCGFPLFAESQTGCLYPLKFLLYTWMPPWLAFGYDTVLSVWLAGLAMYVYLRRRFGAAASLAGAVPFGYGGFMAAHLIHSSYVNSMMWIPLAVLAMERAWEAGRGRYVAYAAMALAMQIFAGNMQIAILTYLLLAVLAVYWAVVALAENTPRRAGWVCGSTGAALVLATLLGAVQILPAKQLLDESPRSEGVSYDELTGQSSWHPELLPTLFLPNAYGSRSHNTDWLDGFYWYHETYTYLGITTLLLACIGGARWRDRWIFGHLVVIAVCLLLMLGRYGFVYDIFQHLPILRGMRAPVRDSVWLGLSVGVLAASGVQRLRDDAKTAFKGSVYVFAVAAVAAVILLVMAYRPLLTGQRRATRVDQMQRVPFPESNTQRQQRLLGQVRSDAAVAGLLVVATLLAVRRPWRSRCAALVPVLVLFDVFWAARHLAPTLPHTYWSNPPPVVALLERESKLVRVHTTDYGLHNAPGYALQPLAVWERAVEGLPLSTPAAWNVDSSKGHTPIHPQRIARYLSLSATDANPYLIRDWQFAVAAVTHLVLPPGFGPAQVGIDPSVWEEVSWPTDLLQAGQATPATVLRNRDVLPRARLIGRVVYADTDRVEDWRTTRFDPTEVIVVDDPDRPLPEVSDDDRDDHADELGTATISEYQAERVIVEVTAERPCYLFLADVFYPEWEVLVDGRPAKLRAAQPGPPQFVEHDDGGNVSLNQSSLAFRAVYLEPGTHRVEFRYSRRMFRRGCLVSFFGFALLVALSFYGKRQWGMDMKTTGELADAVWFRRIGALLLVAALGVSVVTHWEYWKIRTDDDGRWIGSFHTYQWESPLR